MITTPDITAAGAQANCEHYISLIQDLQDQIQHLENELVFWTLVLKEKSA